MAKSVKLTVKPTYDFDLIGIVTTEPIYRLAWLMNDVMDISLMEAPLLKVYHPKKSIIQDFNYFSQKDEGSVRLELVANKGTHGILIEEQKSMDYFFKIYDGYISVSDTLLYLKGIKNISLALKIEPGSLKSKERLLFAVSND